MRVAGSGTATVGAGSGNEGNKAMKDGGMIRDLFPGTRLRWNTHEASVGHARGFSGALTRLQTRIQWCGWGWCARVVHLAWSPYSVF
jgi:hypothetical protein